MTRILSSLLLRVVLVRRSGLCLLLLLLSTLWLTPTQAATLTWDRNNDSDMKDYQVWACFTPSCVVVKSSGNLQPGTVVQPVAGTKPTYTLDIAGKEGFVAVSARDQSLNESGLSVSVPFDAKPPAVPMNPLLQ